MFTIWSKAPSDFTTQQFISALGNNPLVLGQHYYVPNPKPTTGSPAVSPKWDFTSDAEQGHAEAFVIGAKSGSLPAPTGSHDIDWVQLRNVEGQLADTIYRVDTRGGQPPATVSRVRLFGIHSSLIYTRSALRALRYLRSDIRQNIVSFPKCAVRRSPDPLGISRALWWIFLVISFCLRSPIGYHGHLPFVFTCGIAFCFGGS